MSGDSLSILLREIARGFVDQHGSVMVCSDCRRVCGMAIGESSEFHRFDYELFLALLDRPCPVIYEREQREIAVGELCDPLSPEDMETLNTLRDLARQNRKADFRFLARSTGMHAEAVDSLWRTARAALEDGSPS